MRRAGIEPASSAFSFRKLDTTAIVPNYDWEAEIIPVDQRRSILIKTKSNKYLFSKQLKNQFPNLINGRKTKSNKKILEIPQRRHLAILDNFIIANDNHHQIRLLPASIFHNWFSSSFSRRGVLLNVSSGQFR